MSPSCDRIATSASNPEAIARAWAPDPLYDSSNVTARPGPALPLGRECRQQTVVQHLADDRVGPDLEHVGVRIARRATAWNHQHQTAPSQYPQPRSRDSSSRIRHSSASSQRSRPLNFAADCSASDSE